MLKYFIQSMTPVSRTEHMALQLDLKAAEAERDLAHIAHTAAMDRELKATDLLHRSLILWQEVDTTRTGGKPLKALINTLLADAKEQGLWGEL